MFKHLIKLIEKVEKAIKGDQGQVHLIQKTHLNDPKMEPAMKAPRYIQVFTLHGDRTFPCTEYLPTIDTSLEPPPRAASLEPITQATANDAAASHAIRPLDEYFGPPDSRIQPDTRQGYWSADAWANRVVLKTNYFHFLFTLFIEEEVPPNLWTDGILFGDVFVLKLSGTAGSDGSRVYEDILAGATRDQEWDLLKEIVDLFWH